MSNNGDDELERRLRDVLHDRGLGVPASPDAVDRIHAGARRRQQRRTTASALGAMAVIAIAAVAIGVRSYDRGSTNTADNHTPSPSPVVLSASSAAPVSPTASLTSSPNTTSTSHRATASVAVVEPATSSAGSTPPTTGFNPVSVSAISVKDFWVLGYTQSGTTTTTTVMQTTDAGNTFTTLSSPAAVIGTLSRGPAGSATVSDIRFGDSNNGWAYGGSLFSTTDGGTSWTRVTTVPGNVVDLAAASGDVWAVVGIGTSTASYALYHATYGTSGTGAWTQVNLGLKPTAGLTSVVVIKKTAYVLEGSGAQQQTYIVTNGGSTHTAHPGPCAAAPTLGAGQLSVAGDGSLWAWCTAGHESGVFVSTDNALHWQGMVRTTTTSVGGIDSSHVVVSDGTSIGTLTLGHAVTTPAIPATGTQPDATFIGFTTTQVGFAVVTQQVPSPWSLWRTTDGGQTWSVVNF